MNKEEERRMDDSFMNGLRIMGKAVETTAMWAAVAAIAWAIAWAVRS